MDYTDYTEQLKKSLAAFGSAEADIKKLYEQMLEQNEKAYQTTREKLDKQRNENRNQAAVDSQMLRKNTAQFLASRGLTHSGESVQSEINENIALSNRLSKLDSEYDDALKDALLKKGDDDLSARKSYTEQSGEIAQKKAALTAEMYKNYAANSDQPQGGESDGTYTPSSSVKDMAKNLLSSASESGSISSSLENAKLRLLMEKLSKEQNIDPAYMKELELVLKTNGYYDMSVDYAQAYVAADYAKNQYRNWMYETFNKLRKSDRVKEASNTARDAAIDMQMAYIFTHCSTDKAFEKAWQLMGFNMNDIKDYYERAAKGKTYKLGMYA